jgi:peptide/nickel transport system substrate-binding protein
MRRHAEIACSHRGVSCAPVRASAPALAAAAQRPSRISRTRRMFPPGPRTRHMPGRAHRIQRSWRIPCFWGALLLCASAFLAACSRQPSSPPGAVTFLIESMPASLDPRIGTDVQSERLDSLLFSGLVERDAQMNIRGDLAETWETPDPLTYIFRLRRGVYFHDGRPLTSADVKFTFDSILSSAISTPKRSSFRMVRQIDAPDPQTVIFRLTEPYASFLWNVARPAIGIVPAGAGADFAAHPVGSGPFRFVSARQDEEVVLARSPNYFRAAPTIDEVRFRVVPDAIVRALELRKGSADIEMNSLTADMVAVLRQDSQLGVSEQPGTNYSYIAVNFDDPALAHREVRQALAYATDRDTIVRYLLRGQARVADDVLPPNSWAYDPGIAHFGYDPARAAQLLDAAGYPRRPELGGMRLHLVLKISTDEAARSLGAVLQDQWRRAGIDLELRSLEIATLFSDINRGSFQLYYARWVGGNDDPDMFEFIFSSHRMPPNGANRGHYRNPHLDALLDQARVEPSIARRRQLFGEVQRIVGEDLPYLSLWYMDNISVHRRRLGNIALTPTGDYDFLAEITLRSSSQPASGN